MTITTFRAAPFTDMRINQYLDENDDQFYSWWEGLGTPRPHVITYLGYLLQRGMSKGSAFSCWRDDYRRRGEDRLLARDDLLRVPSCGTGKLAFVRSDVCGDETPEAVKVAWDLVAFGDDPDVAARRQAAKELIAGRIAAHRAARIAEESGASAPPDSK